MADTARLNLVVDRETDSLCRELASAKNTTLSELFRQMVQKEAKDNKLLLQEWRKLEKLRK